MDLRVGIAGVSGYTGVELLRVLSAHPRVAVTAFAGGRSAGADVADAWPALAGQVDAPVLPLEAEALAERCDAVFLALPHGVSASVAPALLDAGLTVIDLGADFRLRDPAAYEAAYGAPHPCPERLAQAVYGLPEVAREALFGAKLIANPGCYPTATAIAALPLVEAGLADWVIADCISGVSGAGRKHGSRNLYCEVQESLVAYGVAGGHRHRPEIEQTLGVPVTFTPHLAPLIRGMLATVHVRPSRPVSADEARALFAARYADSPLVRLSKAPPASNEVRGTAMAAVSVSVDPAHGVITACCAIDNLGRGAATQAVANLNLAQGWPESLGLPTFPLLP